MPGEALIRFFGTAADSAGPLPGEAARVPLERRSESRTPTNWIAVIRLSDGGEIPCTVKDVSKSGARLGIPERVALPGTFELKVLGYDFLFTVRLVWRSGHCAGIRIERFGRQPPPAIAPQEARADAAETDTVLGRRWGRYSSY